MKSRKCLFLAACMFTLLAYFSCQREQIPVTSLSINTPQAEIEVGESLQLETVVTPGNATIGKITWSSSDMNVAKVTKKGVVTGFKAGSTTITAAADGFEASCALTVRRKTVHATDLSLDRTSLDMLKHETQWLAVNIAPEGFTDEIVWTSSNPAIVEVSDQGKVVALGCGSAVITVTVGTLTATCTVNVTELINEVTSITLNSYSLNLNKGETDYLEATVLPEDASDRSVVWSSSDPAVVSVNQDGKVTAEKGGYALIRASAGSITAECEVYVFSPVTAITIGAKELTLAKGTSITLNATIVPEDATDKNITWRSDDSSVVSVDPDGTVHALKGGVTKVSAKAGEIVESCTITVIAHVETVTLSKTSLTLEKGGTEILSVTVLPEDATDRTVAWSSSNPTVASVNDYGKVVAEGEGTAVITAKAGGVSADCHVTVVLP